MVNHYPPPNNPKVCKVTLVFYIGSRTWLNVFHLATSASRWVAGDLPGLAQAVKTWVTSYYSACYPSQVGLYQIQLRVLDPAAPLAYDLNISPPLAGGRVGTVEAGNVSVTMSERTGLAGRRHRGRLYVPGVLEGDAQAGDIIGGSLATALASALAQFIIAFVAQNAVPVIFHRPGLTPSTFDNTYDTVTSGIIDTILDSMRRRLPGRGR